MASRRVVIMMTLCSIISGGDPTADVAESSPRRVVVRKSYRYPDFNRMPVSSLIQNEPQFWDNQLLTTVDPNIDLLMRSTAHLISTIRRLEIKFDRVFDAVDSEENVANDVMNKLRQIHQYVQGTSTNACQPDCPSPENAMPQSNLMKELVDAVRYSNENIRKLVTNFDMVTESSRRSMQSLEKVCETVQDINERTIRIQQNSFAQFSRGNPTMVNPRFNGINEGNRNIPTPSNHPTQHFVTHTTYDSTNSGNFNADWNKNMNAGRIDQFGAGTPTNYDSNGHRVSGGSSFVASTMQNYDSSQNRNSFKTTNEEMKEMKNVVHSGNNEQERIKGFEESGIVDQNKMPVAAGSGGPVVSNWNSYETFIGESNQRNNVTQTGNDHTAIQQTQQSYDPKQSGIILGNKQPVGLSTNAASGTNAGVAQANYDSNVSNVFDRNGATTRTNSESTGNVIQNQNSFVYSNVALKGNENVGQKPGEYLLTHNQTNDSKNSGAMDRNESLNLATTNTSYESDKTGVHSPSHSHSHNSSSYSNLTSGKEVIDQRTTSASSSGASSTTSNQLNEQNVASSASNPMTSTQKITTTATTTKVQTSGNPVNSQRTYRNVRKDTKRVTFEPNKRNCHDLTVKRNGIYKFGSLDEVANEGDRFFDERYCDFYTDDRAWTVIQRRFARYNMESFNRTWLDYKLGFGQLDDEFWFGNDFIHKLTFQDDVELRILSEDENGKSNWVEYSLFKMKSEMDNYKLVISGYSSGSVQDSLLYHNDQEFSTYDHRNGNNQQTSCASSIGNGWWFKNCSDEGILGNFLGSTSTKMMIRPKK